MSPQNPLRHERTGVPGIQTARPPRVSVVMAVFNGERFLREAVESILRQTYEDFEFLIADDGSTDGTSGILAEYALSDVRIEVFRQSNIGLTKSLNKLIASARGEFIARMDADDISFPDRFQLQVDYLQAHPQCAVVGCGFLSITAASLPFRGEIIPDDSRILRDLLMSGTRNPFRHGSVLMRRSCLLELNPVYRFRYSQDYDLWLRLGTRHAFGMVEDVLYQSRYHSKGIHADNTIALARQRQVLLNVHLHKLGVLFDNTVCDRVVSDLYGAKIPTAAASEEISDWPDVKALFVKGEFKQLRMVCRLAQKKNKGGLKILAVLLIARLPKRLAHFLTDIVISTLNLVRGTRVLTLSQLKPFATAVRIGKPA